MNKTDNATHKPGRPRRARPKAYAIWCGQISREERDFILRHLSPGERYQILWQAAQQRLLPPEERATMAYEPQNPSIP